MNDAREDQIKRLEEENEKLKMTIREIKDAVSFELDPHLEYADAFWQVADICNEISKVVDCRYVDK